MSATESSPNVLEQYLKGGLTSSARIVARENVPPGSLTVKSLVWTYQRVNPVLVVLPLDSSVDKAKLAQYLKVSGPKHIRMASSDLVFSTTGQTVVNVSPIGHIQPVRTIVDASLVAQYLAEDVSDVTCYGGGGSTGMELEISLRELLTLANAEVADVRVVVTPGADASLSSGLVAEDSGCNADPTEPVPIAGAGASQQ